MSNLYYNRIVPASVISETTQPSGFEAANVLTPSINREFRGTVANMFSRLLLDMGATKKIAGVLALGTNWQAPTVICYDNSSNSVFQDFAPVVATNAFGRQRVMSAPNVYARSIALGFSLAEQPYNNVLAELAMRATAQGPAVSKYTYRSIASPNYTIAAGDVLRYSVWISPSSPPLGASPGAGGVEVVFASGLPQFGRGVPLVDQLGTQLIAEPTIAPRGSWQNRTIALGSQAGRIISTFQLAFEGDAAGEYLAKYRNIRITDSTGTTEKKLIWRGGATDINTDGGTQEYFGVTLEPQGLPSDGESFWRCGAVYVFGEKIEVRSAQYSSGIDVETVHPQSREELANKSVAVATLAQSFDVIKFNVRSAGNQAPVSPLITLPRKDICLLDMSSAGRPDHIWPVRMIGESQPRRFDHKRSSVLPVELREVC